jgi:hypothetical protein
MAQYRVKNSSSLDKAFKVYGGHHIVSAGKEDDVLNAADLSAELIDAFARDGVKVTLIANGKGDQPGKYTVTDKGRGWWAITLDSKEVTKSLREDDVKEFDKLSDADKAAFVDLHKPE